VDSYGRQPIRKGEDDKNPSSVSVYQRMERIYRAPYLEHLALENSPVHRRMERIYRSLKLVNLKADESLNHVGVEVYSDSFLIQDLECVGVSTEGWRG